MNAADVLFVSMPFGPVFHPAIGISLLQSALTRANILTRSQYFSIRFSEIVGAGLYNALSTPTGLASVELAGEWIFSAAAAGRPPDDDSGYVETGPDRTLGVEQSRVRAAYSAFGD